MDKIDEIEIREIVLAAPEDILRTAILLSTWGASATWIGLLFVAGLFTALFPNLIARLIAWTVLCVPALVYSLWQLNQQKKKARELEEMIIENIKSQK